MMPIRIPLRRVAEQMASVSVQLMLPAVCRLCDEPVREGDDFCAACQRALTLSEPMMRSACPRCGVPRPVLAAPTNRGTVDADDADDAGAMDKLAQALIRCQQCQRMEFAFSRVVTLWTYQGLVCDAVVAAKYAHQSPLGDALGRRLGDAVVLQLAEEAPDVVTFVPSHFSRQFTRGGNGNQAIAQAVAARLSLGSRAVTCRQLLKTTRRIAKQAWLDDDARYQNVQGAFAVKKGYAFASVPKLINQHILLVDDVLTTGATASEVSRVLLAAGASRVTLAVVARAIRAN